MNEISPVRQRLRIRYGKTGPLVYVSTLDLAKVWERILRRARVPIAYSQGYTARPRIQLGLALPLGVSSDSELLDVHLTEPVALEEALAAIRQQSPVGLEPHDIREVPQGSPSIQVLAHSALYRFTFEELPPDALESAVARFVASDMVPIRKKRKFRGSARLMDADIRPLVLALTVEAPHQFTALLRAGDHGNLRPAELLAALGLHEHFFRIHRVNLFLQHDHPESANQS
jgi:radical SAM-linked protein